jgi:hypothetical protein
MLTRRGLLKRSALAAPALITLKKEIIKPAKAGSHGALPLAVPAPAATYGLQTLSFLDLCTTLDTVDLSNTKSPAYLWYTNQAWPNAAIDGWTASAWNGIQSASAIPGSDITYSNGIVISGNHAPVWGSVLMSACANGAGYTGSVINMANAAYFEIKMSANPAQQNATTAWPAFWTTPIEFFTGSATHFMELDILEMFPGTTVDMLFGAHDWDMAAQTNNVNTNFNSSIVADASVHTYGTLYLSPSFNGGTGSIQRYMDGTLVSACSFTFSTTGPASPGASPSNPNGIFSQIQNQHAVLILAAGSNWPMTVQHVAVWQQSASG